MQWLHCTEHVGEILALGEALVKIYWILPKLEEEKNPGKWKSVKLSLFSFFALFYIFSFFWGRSQCSPVLFFSLSSCRLEPLCWHVFSLLLFSRWLNDNQLQHFPHPALSHESRPNLEYLWVETVLRLNWDVLLLPCQIQFRNRVQQ